MNFAKKFIFAEEDYRTAETGYSSASENYNEFKSPGGETT